MESNKVPVGGSTGRGGEHYVLHLLCLSGIFIQPMANGYCIRIVVKRTGIGQI